MSTTPSRRQFLGTSAASLAALSLSGCAKADADASTEAALPPAIAALTSMTDGVVPISVDERRARIEKARRLMQAKGIDALMLTGGTSMEYFTGIKWGLSERLLTAVIPVKGAPFLVTPKFEEERAME
jgi:Xaa-Pro dipeptidase